MQMELFELGGSPDDSQVGSTLEHSVRAFVEHCRVARGLSAHTLRAYASDLTSARAKGQTQGGSGNDQAACGNA